MAKARLPAGFSVPLSRDLGSFFGPTGSVFKQSRSGAFFCLDQARLHCLSSANNDGYLLNDRSWSPRMSGDG